MIELGDQYLGSPSSIISRPKKGFLSKKKGHVELDPELEMYREKGIINGQEVAMLRDTGCTKTLVHSSLVSGNVSTTPTS
jgi:hypothetical protein